MQPNLDTKRHSEHSQHTEALNHVVEVCIQELPSILKLPELCWRSRLSTIRDPAQKRQAEEALQDPTRGTHFGDINGLNDDGAARSISIKLIEYGLISKNEVQVVEAYVRGAFAGAVWLRSSLSRTP